MYKLIFIFLTCVFVSTPAWSNQSAPEQPERTIMGDWFTLCAKSQGICTMNQVQYTTDQQGNRSQVLHAHIGKNPKGEMVMQLILPLGVVLPPGLMMKVDQEEPFKVAYHACTGEGCIALVPLPQKRLQSLRKGTEVLIGFRPLGTDKTAVIKMSLKGFTKASNVVRDTK